MGVDDVTDEETRKRADMSRGFKVNLFVFFLQTSFFFKVLKVGLKVEVENMALA